MELPNPFAPVQWDLFFCAFEGDRLGNEYATAGLGRRRLRDADGVAGWVAEGTVAHALGLVDGLLEHLGAGCAHSLEGRVEVVRAEHHHRQDALGKEFLQRVSVGL